MKDKAITEQIIISAQNFIVQVVEFPSQETRGLLVDRVDVWKFRNKLNMVLITKKIVESNNMNVQQISSDVFMALLEEAGRKENVKFTKMFSSLLLGLLNPQFSDSIHFSYIKVLGQLSEKDITILESLYAGIDAGGFDYKTKCFEESSVCRLLGYSQSSVRLSFQNIWRLGICKRPGEHGFLADVYQITFTDYGWNFMKACKLIKF